MTAYAKKSARTYTPWHAYNPYKHDQFVYRADNNPIHKSEMGFLSTTFVVTQDIRIPSVQILGHIA